MIAYGFSIQGKSHIEHGSICQDYNKHLALCGRWYLGVVADGVGSAAHSDIGSRTAVENLCEYCKKHIKLGMTEEEMEDILRSGYEYAFEAVLRYAEDAKDAIEEYDTTLSSALYNGDRVIYGHAGDGGILIRQCDGQIKPITKRQKGADGSSVLPLRTGISSWDFGIVEEKTAAVLLATDGMLDGVFQPVLVNLPSDISSLARGDFSNDHAYITASEFFMNPDTVYQNPLISDADAFVGRYLQGDLDREDEEIFLDCIQAGYRKMFDGKDAMELCDGISKYYYAVWALTNVTDDKSVVCMMNETAKVSPQNMEYYQEPNWKCRQESYNALLYGGSMPTVPFDDPLYRENRKSQERVKGYAIDGNGIWDDLPEAETGKIQTRDDSSSATRIVSKEDIDGWRQQRVEQLEEQKEREKCLQQYLDLQRKRKRKIVGSVVAVLVFCMFVCGLSRMKFRSFMNLNGNGNRGLAVSPAEMFSSPTPLGSAPIGTGPISADNNPVTPDPLTPDEKSIVQTKAEKFVIELAKEKLFTQNTSQNDIGKNTKLENNSEDEGIRYEKDRDEFQKKLEKMGLDQELLGFLEKNRPSEDEDEYKDLVPCFKENASNQIQAIIQIFNESEFKTLVGKEDFTYVFVEEIKAEYKDNKGKQKKILKNLKVLLDGLPENQQSEETVSPVYTNEPLNHRRS